jgi:hypothetical protein
MPQEPEGKETQQPAEEGHSLWFSPSTVTDPFEGQHIPEEGLKLEDVEKVMESLKERLKPFATPVTPKTLMRNIG